MASPTRPGLRPTRSLFAILSLTLTAAVPAGLAAQDHPGASEVALEGVALDDALRIVIARSGASIIFQKRDMAGRVSTCSATTTDAENLLACVLKGHPLSYRKLASGTFIIERGVRSRTVSGYVRDADTGESLIGVHLQQQESARGTVTNRFGFFSLTLADQPAEVQVSYVGYETARILISQPDDTTLVIHLRPANTELGELTVTDTRAAPIEQQTQMSAISVPVGQIQMLPALLGEVDLLKTLQLLPGVQGGLEGTSGVFVRGGSADQNLVLLDGVPVYNVSHMLGFFSVFDGEAVKKVELIKGGFPARYGGRLSSVLDVSLREGNMKETKVSASIGLISARVSVEGPILKEKSSFIVAGRRTYADYLARPFMNEEDGVFGYYFYDLTGKVNYVLSDRDRLYASIYLGDDHLAGRKKNYLRARLDDDPTRTEASRAELGWTNRIASFRWNRLLSKHLFMNTTLIYSRYRLLTDGGRTISHRVGDQSYVEQSGFGYHSSVRDVGARVDVEFLPGSRHHIRLGGGVTRHIFVPGEAHYFSSGRQDEGVDTTLANAGNVGSTELQLYAENDVSVTPRISANVGAHFSSFTAGTKAYTSLQPRFAARYLLTNDWALKASYARMQQYLHLLVNGGMSLPTDLWMPSTDRVRPEESWQVAVGAAWTHRAYEMSLEGYYKLMDHVLEYKPGAVYVDPYEDWQDQVESGRGRSVGLEFFVQKKSGRTTGWFGYGLSWTNRHFPGTDINFGESFPFRYDRRHDLSIAATHRLSRKVELSGSWIFSSGIAATLPQSKYRLLFPMNPDGKGIVGTGEMEAYGGRNAVRLPAHHRLDLGLHYYFSSRPGRERRLSLGLYNAYSRRNPAFIYLSTQHAFKNGRSVTTQQPKKISLFPILPSISYSIRF